MNRRLALLLAGVSLACALLPTVAAAQTRYLEVYNDAPSSLVTLAVAPAGTEAFRAVPIGDRPLIGGGNAVTVAIDGKEGCRRDLRATFADGRSLLQRNFDVCRYRSYRTGRVLPPK
ncbi:hypothetical protein KK141_15485 [Dyella sp. LX-66]|uniref:hypothetical protein n=1 Tax=unclassified Dyella TaxID=2634549 RepID=UPI001BDFA165|nr:MULTISPECIES: hypothetical protein [unclassified Dyella]MBT2118043.1 hypothetical protein [Dyella sp. LX-1]MBT2140950.1 hypothetical protein [Dyella sp. LX-66]